VARLDVVFVRTVGGMLTAHESVGRRRLDGRILLSDLRMHRLRMSIDRGVALRKTVCGATQIDAHKKVEAVRQERREFAHERQDFPA